MILYPRGIIRENSSPCGIMISYLDDTFFFLLFS